MSEATAALVEQIKNLKVVELVELVKALESAFGVSAAAVTAVAPAANGGGAAPAPETEAPTSFNVILTDGGAEKIKAIKVVREITGLGLGEAKAFVEGVPKPLKEGIPKDDAEAIKKKFDEIGAKVEIKGA